MDSVAKRMTIDEVLALLDALTDTERAMLLGSLAVTHRDELAANGRARCAG